MTAVRLAVLLLAAASLAAAQPAGDLGWPNYGNDPGGARYSRAVQIDRANVGQLRVAWTFRTGALQRESPLNRKAAFEDRAWCRERIAASRSEGIFAPPSLKGTIVFPGNVGGVNWGGSAYDPERHLLFANTNRLAMTVRLIPQERLGLESTQGPSADRIRGELALQAGTPYAMRRAQLLSPGGTPCNPPPWGTLAAVDLFTGRKVWDRPLGAAARERSPGC